MFSHYDDNWSCMYTKANVVVEKKIYRDNEVSFAIKL